MRPGGPGEGSRAGASRRFSGRRGIPAHPTGTPDCAALGAAAAPGRFAARRPAPASAVAVAAPMGRGRGCNSHGGQRRTATAGPGELSASPPRAKGSQALTHPLHRPRGRVGAVLSVLVEGCLHLLGRHPELLCKAVGSSRALRRGFLRRQRRARQLRSRPRRRRRCRRTRSYRRGGSQAFSRRRGGRWHAPRGLARRRTGARTRRHARRPAARCDGILEAKRQGAIAINERADRGL